jgi:hypothetical protein
MGTTLNQLSSGDIYFAQLRSVEKTLHLGRDILQGAMNIITLLGFPEAIQVEGPYDIQRSKWSPELPAGNANGTDIQRTPEIEPPQYVPIRLSVKASNEPGQTTNYFQVSLPQGPRLQSGSQKTLFGVCRTYLLTFAIEVMDPLGKDRVIFHVTTTVGQGGGSPP